MERTITDRRNLRRIGLPGLPQPGMKGQPYGARVAGAVIPLLWLPVLVADRARRPLVGEILDVQKIFVVKLEFEPIF
jgi:hypothetical protein